MHHLDHIILGINDLDEGIRQFEALTGVRPVRGGEHPELGTHNALVRLGVGVYLEILAPRPETETVSWLRRLSDIEKLEPFMIVVRTDDLTDTLRTLDREDVGYNPPTIGSRRAPGGSLLQWRLLTFNDPDLSRWVFLIEWSRETVHPSETAPMGCRLRSFCIRKSTSATLYKTLKMLQIDTIVAHDTESSTELVIEGRRGSVTVASTV